jgi:hypothetical protein
MNSSTTIRAVIVGLLAISLVAGTAAPAIAQQETNETATPTTTPSPTADASDCNPDSRPELAQARLHTRDETIEKGSPGVIAGGFLPEAGIECPIVVRISLSVPNNMYIQGTSGIGTGGAGIVAGRFTINPDTEGVKAVRADVFSTQTGERTVTGDITYWPKGYPDMKREISGLALTFNAVEPTQPNGTPTPSPGSGGGIPNMSMTQLLAIAIIGLTLVGGVAAYTKGLNTLNIGVGGK